ncbi:MAG: DUF4932 domain-containing protein [Bacteroidales bacterium]|jgi:hypothetical protein|nr:DUF4932 domain-containing protein [Bacteroidales bacterium]
MKKLTSLIVLFVINSFVFAQKIELNAKVDERCELLSTVFRLAEIEEYTPNEFSVFVDSVIKYFEPYKNHEVVEYCKMYRKKHSIAYDAPMNMAVHLQIIEGKISLIPNVKENSLDSRWDRDALPRFIELLNDFYTVTKFHDFFQTQTIKEKVEIAANEYFKKIDMKWFESFFGEVPEGNFNLVISLSNGNNNYGPNVEYLDGKEDLYSIIICGIDSLNNPVFEDDWAIELIVHEFCHSFCNPLITENYPKMQEKANAFFKQKKKTFKRMDYGDPQIMLFEVLVRASVIQYLADHFQENPQDYLSRQKINGFIWIEELYNLLDQYEENRDTYPTLRSFMPEIVYALNQMDPKRMEKERQKKKPTMLVANITNGDQNVDASTTEIVIKFDKPMFTIPYGTSSGKQGKDYMPKALGAEWNKETKTEWVLKVQLEPNKKYSISFPAQWFYSEDGVNAKNTVYLDFKTK